MNTRPKEFNLYRTAQDWADELRKLYPSNDYVIVTIAAGKHSVAVKQTHGQYILCA